METNFYFLWSTEKSLVVGDFNIWCHTGLPRMLCIGWTKKGEPEGRASRKVIHSVQPDHNLPDLKEILE